MNLSIIYTSTLCLGIFAFIYLVLYRNANRFTLNRFYLLGTALISSIIPFIQLNVFPNYVEINRKVGGEIIETTSTVALNNPVQTMSTIELIYWIGVAFALLILICRLLIVIYKIKSKAQTHVGKYKIINDHNASSFFNYLFLDGSDPVKQRHEEEHSNRLHSLDRVLFGLLICFNWFNPILYIYRYLIIENHEYEADHRTIQALNLEKSTYGNILVTAVKNKLYSHQISNQFNSLIKNRIKMLSNTNTRKISYLFLLPIVIGIFSAFTFKTYPVYIQDDQLISQDTLPGTFEIVDTVSTYDYDTGKESTTIVKAEKSLDEYMQNLEFNNQYFTLVDTITMFDYDTFEESISIVKTKIPQQLQAFYNDLTFEQTSAVYKYYALQQTVKTEADNSGSILLYPSKTGYFLTIFRDGEEITKHRIPKAEKGIKIKDLNLQKGTYNIQRSDTKDIISLTIK